MFHAGKRHEPVHAGARKLARLLLGVVIAWPVGLAGCGFWDDFRAQDYSVKAFFVHEDPLTSFPSGHVLTYVGFYGFLAYLVAIGAEPAPLRAFGVTLLGTLVALVGPSRIQQGHHWPSDVLASYLLGTAYLLALIEVHARLSTRDR